MARETMVVSAYYEMVENPLDVEQGSKADIKFSPLTGEQFAQAINNVYQKIAECGGKVVLESMQKFELSPSNKEDCRSWNGPIYPEPSLLIVAEIPEA